MPSQDVNQSKEKEEIISGSDLPLQNLNQSEKAEEIISDPNLESFQLILWKGFTFTEGTTTEEDIKEQIALLNQANYNDTIKQKEIKFFQEAWNCFKNPKLLIHSMTLSAEKIDDSFFSPRIRMSKVEFLIENYPDFVNPTEFEKYFFKNDKTINPKNTLDETLAYSRIILNRLDLWDEFENETTNEDDDDETSHTFQLKGNLSDWLHLKPFEKKYNRINENLYSQALGDFFEDIYIKYLSYERNLTFTKDMYHSEKDSNNCWKMGEITRDPFKTFRDEYDTDFNNATDMHITTLTENMEMNETETETETLKVFQTFLILLRNLELINLVLSKKSKETFRKMTTEEIERCHLNTLIILRILDVIKEHHFNRKTSLNLLDNLKYLYLRIKE